MIVVTGGARSGKSSFAEKKAQEFGKGVLYIATAIAYDEEMKERILKHREQRPAEWATLEAYSNLNEHIKNSSAEIDCILLDCVTIMVTNLLFQFMGETKIEEADFEGMEKSIVLEILNTVEAAKDRKKQIIFVTNEIGMGIVPDNLLSRRFRDIAGRVNQLLTKSADEVFFLVSGIPIKIKG